MQKRNVLNSPRLLELKKSRRNELKNKILVTIFALAIIFGFSIYLSHLSILNISQIQVSGNNVVNTTSVQVIVNQDISGSYLWIFPKTNIFFYPENKIKADLATNFPRFQNINLSVRKDKTLSISVTERVPEYTWCGNTLPDPMNTNPEQCYFMDDNGYIFDVAPYFSGNIYFKFYGTVSMTNGEVEGSSFASGVFQKLILFKKTLEEMSLNPVALYMEDDGDVHMYLSSETAEMGPEIIFNEGADVQTIAENLDSALSTDPLLTLFKTKYNSLLYIDLRYGDKVYYKFSQ